MHFSQPPDLRNPRSMPFLCCAAASSRKLAVPPPHATCSIWEHTHTLTHTHTHTHSGLSCSGFASAQSPSRPSRLAGHFIPTFLACSPRLSSTFHLTSPSISICPHHHHLFIPQAAHWLHSHRTLPEPNRYGHSHTRTLALTCFHRTTCNHMHV